MNAKQAVEVAQQRPLSEVERASLRAALGTDSALGVGALEVVEASALGQARLSADEASRLFDGALSRVRRPRRWVPVLAAAALAAGLLAVAGVSLRGGRGGEGLKGGEGELTVLLVAQAPGDEVGRVVHSKVTLRGAEALRVVARLTAPRYVALYEDQGGPKLVWRSEQPLPAGDSSLGPQSGRAGLQPERNGVTTFWVVASPTPDVRGPGCDGCREVRFDVER